MPTGNVVDVTADENRVIFLKRNATTLFNRVKRLVYSLLVQRFLYASSPDVT